MSEEKAIHKAILSIMRDIGAIGKEGTNEQQKFPYRRLEDVYNRVQPLMRKYGIYSVSEIVACERQERKTSKGNPLLYSVLTVKYTFYAEDGSCVATEVVGEGMDSGDKASSKAMSVAHKYAICQMLAIPFDVEDPDRYSPQLGPDSISKDEWNAIAKQWWDRHKMKLDGVDRSDRMKLFEEWACKHAGRKFGATNWREWRMDDRRACLDALNPPGAVTSDPEKLADETKKQLDKELAESKGK